VNITSSKFIIKDSKTGYYVPVTKKQFTTAFKKITKKRLDKY